MYISCVVDVEKRKNSPLSFLFPSYSPRKKPKTEELVRDGESDNIQSIDVVSFNKL